MLLFTIIILSLTIIMVSECENSPIPCWCLWPSTTDLLVDIHNDVYRNLVKVKNFNLENFHVENFQFQLNTFYKVLHSSKKNFYDATIESKISKEIFYENLGKLKKLKDSQLTKEIKTSPNKINLNLLFSKQTDHAFVIMKLKNEEYDNPSPPISNIKYPIIPKFNNIFQIIMPNEKHEEEVCIYSKGTELDILAKNIVECAFDENEMTRESMKQSIIVLGINEPKLILSLILSFLKKSSKNKKIPMDHRIILLICMKEILKQKDSELIDMVDFVIEIIKQVVEELTSSKDIIPEWQLAASDILVTLSTNYCPIIMTEIIEKLQPSVLPHYFVIHVLGAMAANNPYGMVSFLSSIITQFLTLLSLAKTDNFKWVMATSLSQFCEAILEYVANPDRAPDPNVTIPSFSNYIFSAFEVFFSSWINTKEPKLRKAVLDAIGNMVFIIERNNFESYIPKLLSGIIQQYKKHNESYHVTKALSQILQAATGQYVDPSSQLSSNSESPVTAESPLIIECASLNNEIDNVVNVLFLQLQQSLEASHSSASNQELNSIRNQNEIKRCFTTICMAYPDQIIANCLHKLEGPEKQKLSSLIVLRHVISSCDKHLREKRSQIISSLRTIAGDNVAVQNSSNSVVVSNNVKMQLAHVIIAMGGQNYLCEVGGLKLIEFIVRNCSISKSESKTKKKFGSLDSPSGQIITNMQLRSFCENVLKLSSSTVKSMRTVLWPYLMELIVPTEYTEAVGTICCAVHNLFSNENGEAEESESDQHMDIECIIDYDIQVNIPGPQFLLSRLIVLTGVPTSCNFRAIHILKAMKVLVYNFHENLPAIWNIVIPKLILYLEKSSNDENDDGNEGETTFNILQWEELLLKLVAKSIEHINDEDWTAEFGEALGQQIPNYDKYPEEKGFLFKCLGTVMANSNKKSFIDKHMDLIFHSTRHTDNSERTGFAVGFGLCAAAHLDTVLSKLELFCSSDTKKSNVLFGLFKDKIHASDNTDKDLIRASILLAYANAIFYAPRELVTSRLESYVVKALTLNIKHHKDKVIVRLIIESIDLVARAIHYNKLKQNYKFEMRNELISCLLNYIDSEPSSSIHSDIRALVMRTIGNLIILHPPITNVELQKILTTCIDNIFSLPPDGIPLKKSKDFAFEEAQNFTFLMIKTIENLNDLIMIILKTYFSDLTFNEIYKVIRSRLTSDQECVRERALSSLNILLKSYCDEVNEVTNNGKPFSGFGTVLGDIIPRLADPGINNRTLAIDCVGTVLKIQVKLEIGRDSSTDQIINSLPSIKDRLKKSDSNILFAAVNDVTKIICKRIYTEKIPDLLKSLYEGLKDTHKHGASAVGVMLNGLFRIRYADLVGEVSSILTTLHDILPSLIDNPKTGVLRSVKILSTQYLVETLNTIMAQTLPLDEVWAEMLCNISNDEAVLDKFITHLVEIQSRTIAFEEREDPSQRKVKGQPVKVIRYSCHIWLAAMNCLQILCSNSIECGQTCLTRMYSKLFVNIIIGCSSTIICSPFIGKSLEKKSGLEANLTVGVRPISISCEALKNFLVTTQSHEIIEEINIHNAWEKLDKEEDFMDFIALITRSICEHKRNDIGFILSNLSQYSNSNYEQHRILVTGFFGAAISELASLSLDHLIDTNISLLLSRLGDKSLEVRRLSLLGIGNVGRCNDVLVQKHATSLLSALLMGMDDRQDSEDKLINAAMDGLASLIVKLTERDIRDVLVTVCLRMLSCYERDSPNVRASAFRLFGSLAKLATGPSRSRFLAEIDSVIVPLLVHLEDSSNDVIRACKVALKQIIPLYGAVESNEPSTETLVTVTHNKLSEFIISCLREDTVLHFGEFCNNFAKIIVDQFPDKVNDIIMRTLAYFKSEYAELAASAVLLIGCLMENLPDKQKLNLQKGQICVELIQLLRFKNPKVRSRTAEAIGLLHMY